MERRAGPSIGLLLGFAFACASSALAESQSAPADEYFGRPQMSPLEITNRINAAERGGASYWRLMATQSAIEDWERRYPNDPWIPSREYRMSHLFLHLDSSAGSAEAHQCRSFLRTHFP
jgi:hypothetical protein